MARSAPRTSASSPIRGAASSVSGAAPSSGPSVGGLERLALALFVARWLVPVESAAQGETLWISLAWLGVLTLLGWRSWRNGGAIEGRITLWEWLLGLLVLGEVVGAAGVFVRGEQRRAALNLAWEWGSLGASLVWMLRQSATAPQGRRIFVLLVLGAAGASTVLAMWQFFVWRPQMAAAALEYEDLLNAAAPDGPSREDRRRLEALRNLLGPAYVLRDDESRAAFRQRLVASVEPTGPFALANSLGGLLAVGLVLGLDALLAARGAPGWRRLASVIVLAAFGYVLLLTKSRTALVGAAAGLGLWGVIAGGPWTKRGRGTMAGVALAVGLLGGLVVVAWASGGVDRFVLSEAGKSLRYRMEYWTGASQVIRQHPLIGIGPGNFRQHYLQFKPPGSSEEILDPHNLFLDAWASGGLLALLAMIGLCGATLWAARPVVNASSAEDPIQRAQPPDSADAERLTAGGGSAAEASPPHVARSEVPRRRPETRAAGESSASAGRPAWNAGIALLLAGLLAASEAWAFAGAFDSRVVGLAVVGVAVVGVWPRATASPSLGALLGSWAALSVHLLGAGGFSMPGVMQLWLGLSGLCVATRGRGRVREASATDAAATRTATISSRSATAAAAEASGQRGLAAIVAAGVVLFVGQLVTATAPGALCRSEMLAAEGASLRGDAWRRQELLLESALRHDPLDPEPCRRLALAHFEEWHTGGETAAFNRAIAAIEEAHRRDPRSAQDHRLRGELHISRWARDKSPGHAAAAVSAFEQAAVLYPELAPLQASLAEAYTAANQAELSRTAAQRALRLDDLNRAQGHYDKLLPAPVRRRMLELSPSTPESSGA